MKATAHIVSNDYQQSKICLFVSFIYLLLLYLFHIEVCKIKVVLCHINENKYANWCQHIPGKKNLKKIPKTSFK